MEGSSPPPGARHSSSSDGFPSAGEPPRSSDLADLLTGEPPLPTGVSEIPPGGPPRSTSLSEISPGGPPRPPGLSEPSMGAPPHPSSLSEPSMGAPPHPSSLSEISMGGPTRWTSVAAHPIGVCGHPIGVFDHPARVGDRSPGGGRLPTQSPDSSASCDVLPASGTARCPECRALAAGVPAPPEGCSTGPSRSEPPPRGSAHSVIRYARRSLRSSGVSARALPWGRVPGVSSTARAGKRVVTRPRERVKAPRTWAIFSTRL
jgi:hypothetical protein